MNETDAPSDSGGTAALVAVAVVRSGGVAGIRRRWEVQLHADVDVWISLIERCPWAAPEEGSSGADRYVWSIRARTPQSEHERELADSELRGAWRELVDAVRAASADDDDSAEAAPR